MVSGELSVVILDHLPFERQEPDRPGTEEPLRVEGVHLACELGRGEEDFRLEGVAVPHDGRGAADGERLVLMRPEDDGILQVGGDLRSAGFQDVSVAVARAGGDGDLQPPLRIFGGKNHPFGGNHVAVRALRDAMFAQPLPELRHAHWNFTPYASANRRIKFSLFRSAIRLR